MSTGLWREHDLRRSDENKPHACGTTVLREHEIIRVDLQK